MKKTKSLPAIIMLVAGLIDCIFSIYYHLSLWEFTRQLLLVLIIFYLIGCVVAIVIDINFKVMEEEEKGEDEEEEPLDLGIEIEPEKVDISEEEEESEDAGDSEAVEETAESA
jgi:phosphotransferase system  glucose/maltose/N-acetylglucosamine-specific IIC component